MVVSMDLHDVVYVTNLAGQINNTSSLKWSPENKIAVLTDEGVRILSFPCSPCEGGYLLHVEKSYIRNPDDALDLAGRYNADFLLRHLDTEAQHYLMLDHTLSPGTSNAPLHKTYRTVEWSPQHLPQKKRCLLATLTIDHRLQLWREGAHGDWQPIAELSDMFYKQMKERWKDVQHPEQDPLGASARATAELDRLMQRTFSVAAVELVWSHLFTFPGMPHFALLIEAMRSGLLVFWKVQPSDCEGEWCCEVIKEEQTKLTFVNKLCWQETSLLSGVLIAGSCDGRVIAFPALMEDQTLRIGPALELWETDQIPVQQIVSQVSQPSETCLIFVTKSRYLLCFRVSYDEGELALHLQKSNFSKDACTQPVTAIDKCPSRDYDLHVILSTLGRDIIEVKMTKDLAFLCRKLKIELPSTLEPMGLGISRNGVYVGILSHIATMYDQFRVKEPLQLIIHCIVDIDKVCDLVLGGICHGACSLADLADCLDKIHLHMCNRGTLPLTMRAFLSGAAENPSQLNTKELQLFRYLESVKVATTGAEESEKNVKRASELILQRHIMSLVEKYTECKELNSDQTLSARLFADWMFLSTSTCDGALYRMIKEDPSSVKAGTLAKEMCVICGGDVPMKSMYYGECSRRHRFGRCMHSLLVCHETPNHKCASCHTLSHKRSIWEKDPLCIFCGTSLR